MPNLGGILFTTICAAFAVVLWMTRPRPGASANAALLAVRSALPPLLLLTCLVLGVAYSPLDDTLRLHATSLDVDASGATVRNARGDARHAFQVGGGAISDGAGDPDLWVPTDVTDTRTPYREFATVDVTSAGGRPALAVRLTSWATDEDVTIASYEDKDGGGRGYIGATELHDGDALCFERCGTQGAPTYVFHGGRLTGAAPLQTRPGLPGAILPWGPNDAIYPLRTYLPASKGARGTPCETLACGAPDAAGHRAPLRSFLFETHDLRLGVAVRRRWFVMLIDPGARLSGGDTPVPGRTKPSQDIIVPPQTTDSPTVSTGIRIFRAQLPRSGCTTTDDDLLRRVRIWALGEGGDAGCNGKLRERRSFHLSVTDASRYPDQRKVARLTLDTPEDRAIGSFDTPRARLVERAQPGIDDAFSLGWIHGATRRDSTLAAAIAVFDNAFAVFKGIAPGPVPNTPCRADRGELCAGNGAHAIHFRIDRMVMPWMLLWIAIAAALVVHLASSRVWARGYAADGVVLALTQFLLALRAVIGIEGAFVDTALDWPTIYGESAIDLVALPTILLATRARRDTDLGTVIALFAFNLLAYAAAYRWLGRFDPIQLLFIALALGSLVGRAATATGPGTWVADRWQRMLDPVPGEPRYGTALKVVLVVLIAVRFVLPVIGFKEHLGPIAVSTLYLPPMLVLLAVLLAIADRAPPERRFRLGLGFVLVAGLALAAPAFSRDNGFVLVYLWPIFGVALWRALAWRREAPVPRRATWPWLAPIPTVVAGYIVLMLLLVTFQWSIPDIAAGQGRDDPAVLSARLERVTGISADYVRLMAVVAPDKVAALGTSAGVRQMEQTIHLVERTNSWTGKGYMRPSNLPIREDPNLGILREVHLTDNVSAVHLMAPFGRLGAVAFLAVLAAAALGLCARPTRPELGPDWGQPRVMAGVLAIWTVFGAAAYMILANLLLVPFTGRDIYLLAPSSGSDLLEGLALLLMTRIGFERKDEA